MKTITKNWPRGDIYPIESRTGGKVPALFDIETTGLGADSSYIYLIGVLIISETELSFTQWFAEGPADERSVLESFISCVPENACLIGFNGRGFDIPFICKKCKQFDIRCFIPQLPDIDLYRSFSALKDFFNMPNKKLVSFEKLVGIEREDKYNGGELIEVYKEYVGKRRFAPEDAMVLEKMLLLHNEEDIVDMVPVLALFSINDLKEGAFKAVHLAESSCSDPGNSARTEVSHSIQESTAASSVPENLIRASVSNQECSASLVLEAEMYSDFPFSHERIFATMPGVPEIKLNLIGRTARFTIPVIKARLRHFFPDYKNYYYLPEEDTAIHKSLAEGVDASHRVHAKKENAYSWANGEFIPVFTKNLAPLFKYNYADTLSFLPAKSFNNQSHFTAYIKSLF